MKDRMCKVVVGVIAEKGGASVAYRRAHDGKHLGSYYRSGDAYFDFRAAPDLGVKAGAVLDTVCAAALEGMPEGRTNVIPDVFPNRIDVCWRGEATDLHFNALFGERQWVVSFGYEDVPVVRSVRQRDGGRVAGGHDLAGGAGSQAA